MIARHAPDIHIGVNEVQHAEWDDREGRGGALRQQDVGNVPGVLFAQGRDDDGVQPERVVEGREHGVVDSGGRSDAVDGELEGEDILRCGVVS